MFVLVNLKTYPCDPLEIATAVRDVDETTDARLAVAPQAIHIERVAETGVETWAQHVDPIEHGSNTGHTLAESVADAGAVGTLVNHSERRLKLADIDGAVRAAERADLETVVCANNPEQIGAGAALGPDAVAVEPPELIGTGTPVSQADPGVVENAVVAAENVDDDVSVLCGAGISTGEDVTAADDLGTEGVLLASGVAKADNPRAALDDLVEPL
ncbi:triose-phosphate isomerase [Natronobacterium gregoryi]|uniref:Triosephosphate isomerase n=2 Tax=Natronobacterium gregoryi TaxID=44930 RepID=L0AMM6_NATGS|nr:triose-phosphate isomerase [Natronobacterium gregoryi]AFZ74709.1 triosephosphate isomerase [Natronobacterium gregoryi SP2]ELY73386.1 triosephosphate isomerase [Natronobacterium gregoryi SP2]PLK20953.1 triose-phosphate isomerase [Natronobacterium gregoryi SP2]SFJ04358.1 triosephosphate isomerase [Natronobacterium gregoryi]